MYSMVTWIPSIYPSHVTIYGSTMDPSWVTKSLFSMVKSMVDSIGCPPFFAAKDPGSDP